MLQLQSYLTGRLTAHFPEGETTSLVRILGEYLNTLPDAARQSAAEQCLDRLVQGEPIQYITGYSWFYDLKLTVTPAVLIPRPETEELADWIIRDIHEGLRTTSPDIIDIGTGSGCIALALKKHLPGAHVTATDISADALGIARANAAIHGLEINFLQHDFLHDPLPARYDLIVSNPPYISHAEYAALSGMVRDYEPSVALAPLTDDPLIFYRRIAETGAAHLQEGGSIYVEISEFRPDAIRALFIDHGYHTDLRKDMQGKWRMLKATPCT